MTTTSVKRGFNLIASIFQDVTSRGGIFAGSFPAWCAFDDKHEFPPKPGDVDVFPRNQLAHQCLKEFFALHEQMYLLRESNWAITYYWRTRDANGDENGLDIQLINPIGEIDADKLLKTFDLRVAKAAFISPTELIVAAGFYTSMYNKILEIDRINHPFASLRRVVKYSRKGFDIAPLELLKIFDAWDAMTPELKKSARDTIIANADQSQDEMFWDEPEDYWEY